MNKSSIECSPDIIELLDTSFPKYDRIKNETVNIGWITESNIYWNKILYEMIEFGWENLIMSDHPHRGLFWVKLRSKQVPSIVLFVSTAHLPWSGSPTEITTHVNQRIVCSLKICDIIKDLLYDKVSNTLVEPVSSVILGGDFNDDYHPIRILKDQLNLVNVFEMLDMFSPITHPVRPSDVFEEERPNRTLDWITCQPTNCRVLGAYVKTMKGYGSGNRYPPSDHYPVIAFFEFYKPFK
jgi:hypothetical protein